eukprot:4018015-Alexandrium_andersonii.AAC.1
MASGEEKKKLREERDRLADVIHGLGGATSSGGVVVVPGPNPWAPEVGSSLKHPREDWRVRPVMAAAVVCARAAVR